MDNYSSHTSHISYSIQTSTSFKQPQHFKFIDSDVSIPGLPASSKYALSYPPDKSSFSVYVVDSEFQPKSKTSKATAKRVAQINSQTSSGIKSIKHNKAIHELRRIKNQRVLSVSNDANHVLSIDSKTGVLTVWQLPFCNSFQIENPNCLSGENYTWDTEINTVSISNNLGNDRLIIMVNSRSGVEIFLNDNWKVIDQVPVLDMMLNFGYIFLVNFNSSVIAKIVDLQGGKCFSVYHDKNEVAVSNFESDFNLSTFYFLKEIGLDKIVIVTEIESKTGSILDRKQVLKFIKIDNNSLNSMDFLDTIPGQARITEISSNKTHISAVTTFGITYLFNIFSLKLEKVFVEQTRYCGDQISLHPYVGTESGQIFSISLSNQKRSNNLMLISDGYNLSVIQQHVMEEGFLRFWKTCKFYLSNGLNLVQCSVDTIERSHKNPVGGTVSESVNFAINLGVLPAVSSYFELQDWHFEDELFNILDEFHQIVLILYGFFKQFDSETSTRADTWVMKILHKTREQIFEKLKKLKHVNPEYLERFLKVFLCKYVLGVSFEVTKMGAGIKTSYLKQVTLTKVIEFTKKADSFLASVIISWFDENVEGNLLSSDSPDDIQNDEMLAEVWKRIHDQSVLWLLEYGDTGFRQIINVCCEHLDKFSLNQPFRHGMSVLESLKCKIFDESFCRQLISENKPLKKSEILILEKMADWCDKREVFRFFVESKILKHAIRLSDELENYPTKAVLMYKNQFQDPEIIPTVLDSVYNFLLRSCEISYSDKSFNVTDKTIVLVLQITNELFSKEVMLCLQEKLLQDVENTVIQESSKNELFWHEKSPEIILTLLINVICNENGGYDELNAIDVNDDETIAYLRVNCGLDMVGLSVDEKHKKKGMTTINVVQRCLSALNHKNDSFSSLSTIKKFSFWYINVQIVLQNLKF